MKNTAHSLLNEPVMKYSKIIIIIIKGRQKVSYSFLGFVCAIHPEAAFFSLSLCVLLSKIAEELYILPLDGKATCKNNRLEYGDPFSWA